MVAPLLEGYKGIISQKSTLYDFCRMYSRDQFFFDFPLHRIIPFVQFCTIRHILRLCKRGDPWRIFHPAKHEKDLLDTINRVAFGNERVVLRRRGKEIAAVVPIADLRLLEELENRIDLVDARAALAGTKKKGAKSLDVILKELGL